MLQTTPNYPIPSRFNTCQVPLMSNEGGFANDPSDAGGTTNFGISLRFAIAQGQLDHTHPKFAMFDLDMDGDVDGQDIRLLTRQEAINVYYTCFWQREDLDSFPSPLDGALFDQSVNGGQVAAMKILQRSLNHMIPQPITVDGVVGPTTRGMVSGLIKTNAISKLMAWYRLEAQWRYQDIVKADPTQTKYLAGWVARAQRLGGV